MVPSSATVAPGCIDSSGQVDALVMRRKNCRPSEDLLAIIQEFEAVSANQHT